MKTKEKVRAPEAQFRMDKQAHRIIKKYAVLHSRSLKAEHKVMAEYYDKAMTKMLFKDMAKNYD